MADAAKNRKMTENDLLFLGSLSKGISSAVVSVMQEHYEYEYLKLFQLQYIQRSHSCLIMYKPAFMSKACKC